MLRRWGRLAGILALGLPGAVGAEAEEPAPSADPIGSVQVYLTTEQALQQSFPEAARFDLQQVAVDAGLQANAGALGLPPFAADSAAFYIARDAADTVLGYACIGDEIGKYRPITFLVAVDPTRRVSGVAILVYRESRGGEVRRQRFLGQYRGKGLTDPIRINRDIVNITGATLSVRALNAGVRKALLLLDTAQGHRPSG